MSNILSGLTLPLKYESGQIVDGAGKTIIKANRTSGETPLLPAGRDAILKLACELLNNSFEHCQADTILKKLGY